MRYVIVWVTSMFKKIGQFSSLFLSYGVLLFFLSSLAHAERELTIEITSGSSSATPIAIVPFHWFGSGILPEDIGEIVSSDLERSGLFKPLSRDNMLSRPFEKKDVFFKDWRVLGMEYLVTGRVLPVGSQFSFEFELYDVFKGETIEFRKGTSLDLRAMAHHISDIIFEKLTGIKGAFSTQILYITVDRGRDNKKRYRLQKADADGYRAETIYESFEPVMSPSWSPDGKKIAYVSFQSSRPAIYIQEIYTGRQFKWASFKGINGAPDWSPDGTRMAVTLSKDGNPEIYILSLSSGKLDRITDHYSIDTEPRWSPSGNSLIFTSDRGGSPQIYEIDLASRQLKRLTFTGTYNARGELGPTGKELVMVHQNGGRFHIAVQDLQKQSFSILTQTLLDESPSISPNGIMVIYATQERGQGVLSAVSIDGQVKFRLPARSGEVREPAWSPFLH